MDLYRILAVFVAVVWMVLSGVSRVLLGLAFLGVSLHALDPEQRITQYAHSAWNRDNGQLSASVLALTQTTDGSLWVGTDFGLQRFDGVRFQTWAPPPGQPLASDYVIALAPAGEGGLWIGTREGLSHWQDNRVRNYQTSEGLSGPVVNAVLVDRTGTVWAATAGYHSGGLCRMEGDTLRCGIAGAMPGRAVVSLFEDRAGTLWAGGFGLCRLKSGTLACPSANPAEIIHSMAQDPQGSMWVAGTGLQRMGDSGLAAYPPAAALGKLQIKALLADRDGGLWIGTHGQGLIRLHQGRIDRFTHADGLSHDTVRSLLEDREGNIWVGTDAGLDRFREYAITRISRREGISASSVNAVFARRNGGIWVGSGGGLNLIHEDGIRAWSTRDGLPSDNVIGIFEEQGGRLWVFTFAGPAYRENGRFHAVQLPSSGGMSIRAAAETADHSVWLTVLDRGLIRLQNGRVAELLPWSKFENRQVWALAADPIDGGLWLGFAQGGVAYYKPGQPIRWYPAAGPGGAVTDLHRAHDGSLWIATRAGLGRLHKQKWDTLTTANGLPCNGIRGLLADDSGALWLNLDCGLASISSSDLSRWSAQPSTRVPVKVFAAADGMRRVLRATGYFRNAAKSTDGRLWFAAFDAVAVVNPKRLPENRIPPPVSIEEITSGPNTYSGISNPQLPPATRELRIRYTAMSFVAPEKVRFRYRLDGFDNEWKDDSGSRQAVYTNLPPKRYRFRVIACNNDGVWNQTGASLAFSIQPAYYQTGGFQLLCGLAGALLLWSGYRLRLRQMGRRLRLQFETRLQERNRIAREMHDSLLQQLSGCALEVDGLAKNGGLPATFKEHLRELRQQIEECAREAREFVWDLRAPVLQEVDLSQALREAGEQVTEGEAVHFHVTVHGRPRPASVKLQQQLFRIVQEATRNAVRYSRAKEIAMEIAYLDSDQIRVHMRDDGCGFDPEQVSRESGHWGLRTMRERAEQVGGELKILSAPGRGTSIEIVAPLASPA